MMVSGASNAARSPVASASGATQSTAGTPAADASNPIAANPSTDKAASPAAASTPALAANATAASEPSSTVVDARNPDLGSRFSDLLRAAAANDDAAPDADDTADAKPHAADDKTHADAATPSNVTVVDAFVQMPGMAPVPLPAGFTLPTTTATRSTEGGDDRGTAVADDTGLVAGASSPSPTSAQAGAANRSASRTSADAGLPAASSNTPGATNPTLSARVGAVAEASNGADRSRRDANDVGAARESARAGAKVDAGASADTAAAPRDRAPASTSSSNGVAPQAAAWSSAMDAANGSDGSQTSVKLPVQSPTQWRQPLTEALGDKLQWQLNRNSEQATIRLDPPMLGRIEISIRQEAGALQVQLSATNSEVLRQLHGIGDNLRHDLSQRQSGEVAVMVTDASRDAGRDLARDANAQGQGQSQGQGRGRDRDAQGRDSGPGRALAEAEADSDSSTPFSLARE